MPKLNSRFNLPAIPIYWTFTVSGKTHRIEWRPSQSTFYDWVKAVHEFCQGNGINPLPTEEQMEMVACKQIPSSYCTGNQRQVAQPSHVTIHRSGGCSSCGGRH